MINFLTHLNGTDGRVFDEKSEEDGTSKGSKEVSSEDDTGNSEEDEEEESSDTESDEEELDEESLKETKALYKLLKNPSTQKATVEMLAKAAGLLKDPETTTKQDVKVAKDSILSILESELGENMKWLAPKLEKAFNRILEQERESTTSSVAKLEETQLANEVSRVYSKLAAETKGASRKLEARMAQLADEILPSPTMSTEKYVRHLYTLANGESAGRSSSKQMADKINRNSKDVASRLAGTSSGSKGDKSQQRSDGKNPTLRESVASAARQLGYLKE